MYIWYNVVEFLVGFVLVINKEPSSTIFSLFSLFLVTKFLHWGCNIRVAEREAHELSEQLQQKAKVEVVRKGMSNIWTYCNSNSITGLLLLSVHMIDLALLAFAYSKLISSNYSSMIMIIFGFELSLLYNDLIITTTHFLNHLGVVEEGYHKIGKIEKFIIVATEFLKLSLYIFFSILLLSNYCLPLHIFRESFTCLRLLITKIRSLIFYNQLSQAYTAITTSSGLCIICRDYLEQEEHRVVKLNKCGHVMHDDCLIKWLVKSASCPTCRCYI